MNIKYTGTLDVEPNAFSLEVERMFVRHDEVSFDFHGRNYETGILWEFKKRLEYNPKGITKWTI